jgi:hypothetical protein
MQLNDEKEGNHYTGCKFMESFEQQYKTDGMGLHFHLSLLLNN